MHKLKNPRYIDSGISENNNHFPLSNKDRLLLKKKRPVILYSKREPFYQKVTYKPKIQRVKNTEELLTVIQQKDQYIKRIQLIKECRQSNKKVSPNINYTNDIFKYDDTSNDLRKRIIPNIPIQQIEKDYNLQKLFSRRFSKV